jgi:hypothetical protein
VYDEAIASFDPSQLKLIDAIPLGKVAPCPLSAVGSVVIFFFKFPFQSITVPSHPPEANIESPSLPFKNIHMK